MAIELAVTLCCSLGMLLAPYAEKEQPREKHDEGEKQNPEIDHDALLRLTEVLVNIFGSRTTS